MTPDTLSNAPRRDDWLPQDAPLDMTPQAVEERPRTHDSWLLSMFNHRTHA